MLLFVCSTAVESRLVRLDTSCTVILPPMLSVLCFMDFNLNDLTSVARFVKIPPLWQVIKKIFVNTFKVYMVLGKVFSSLWHNLYGFGQFFIAINCQILKTQFGRMVTLDLTYVKLENPLQLIPPSIACYPRVPLMQMKANKGHWTIYHNSKSVVTKANKSDYEKLSTISNNALKSQSVSQSIWLIFSARCNGIAYSRNTTSEVVWWSSTSRSSKIILSGRT